MDNNNQKNVVLELDHICKYFPGVKALDDVSFRLREGEIHALIGENGAGKSTLIKVITGVYQPDRGDIFVYGEKVKFTNTGNAFAKGISVVHQERNLIPTFTVAENIFLQSISNKSSAMIKIDSINKEAKKYLDIVGLDLRPEDSIENLSSAQKQMIEIARALSMKAKILLLDEPTSSISVKEVELLLKTIRKLKESGVSILYVSHKLEEIFAVSDSITVLRDGKNAGDTYKTTDLTRDRLIELMVGRKEAEHSFQQRDLTARPIYLEACNVRSKYSPHEKSFTLKKGEILGWYGLVGSGRTEFARTLIGYDPARGGEIKIGGKKVRIRSIAQAYRNCNISYVSENRKEEGLFLQHSIKANISVTVLDKIRNKIGFISYSKENQFAEEYRKKLEIKTAGVDVAISTLSGGNQQKVCIAKGMITEPEILIFDEPTVGIDIKTKGEIHELIYKLAESGKSVIVISSDLAEMVQIADRILVFKDGEICGELRNTKNYGEMSNQIMENILTKTAINE